MKALYLAQDYIKWF